MKCRLTKYEKETIILFNEAEPTANIYTYNKATKHCKTGLQNSAEKIRNAQGL